MLKLLYQNYLNLINLCKIKSYNIVLIISKLKIIILFKIKLCIQTNCINFCVDWWVATVYTEPFCCVWVGQVSYFPCYSYFKIIQLYIIILNCI